MKLLHTNKSKRLFPGLILFFFLLLSVSVTHAENYTFVTKWGSMGTDDGEFAFSYGIAVDSSDNVYVADTHNHRIQKFNSSGGFIAKWGSYGTGDGQFNLPYGIAVDSSDNVYVADFKNYRIQKFDSNGNFITKWNIYNSNQAGIAVNSFGNVYVSDIINHSIQGFDSSGNNISIWGSEGIGDGQFNTPRGIAVDSSDNVYVADASNNRIQKFDSSGSFITKWGSYGTDDGQFNSPYDVAVDSSDNVYVADTYNHRIQKFNSSGGFITKWGMDGTSDGQFRYPTSVAVDSSGNVYVDDDINYRIQKFTNIPEHGKANLHLSKQAPVSEYPSTSMTYTLYYQNFGNYSASNVILVDELSNNVSFESASDDGIYNPSTRKVTWDIGHLDPLDHGYRTLTVMTPLDVIVGTEILNNASISTPDPEIRYDDNYAQAQTTITLPTLPPNVSVINPHLGGVSTPTVWWFEPTIFSYHSCQNATAVGINIHIDDGDPDIVANMAGGPPDWNYTTTFHPRYGKATVTYTISDCTPEIVSFDIYIDPAGHIYDIDTGKRIEGASVWLQRPDGQGGWEDVPTGQNPPVSQPDINPLTSDKNGMYQWDVLEGAYRVHVEAPGYEPANSIVVSIPPPVTDLHVGLHHINDFLPPSSITNLQSTNGTSWINWTWINPTDPDFNHTEIYLNGTFQNNTFAEYFNATGLQPETDYIIGTRTVDIDGNVNETWVNATAKTLSLPDTTFPVIESVVLFPTSTETGSTISVTVNATDNIGVVGVNANDIPLINQGGSIWNGSLTALEGAHYVNVSAEDAAKNIAWNNSTSYTAVTTDNLPPSSITNLRSTNGTNWLNWTLPNPENIDFQQLKKMS